MPTLSFTATNSDNVRITYTLSYSSWGGSDGSGLYVKVKLNSLYVRSDEADTYRPFTSQVSVRLSGNNRFIRAVDDTIYKDGGVEHKVDWVNVDGNPSGEYTYRRTSHYDSTVPLVLYFGSQYSSTASIPIPAKPHYTIAYDANGGTGAPSQQTKWYGESLTLRTGTPTRTDYSFSAWNTSSTGTGTSYASGASYTRNADATLYAVWEQIYRDPIIRIDSVQRVDESTHEADELGSSAEVTFSWSLFDTPSGTNHPTSVAIACNGVTETLTTLTGVTGTTTTYVDADCSIALSYTLTVTLTDEGGSERAVTATATIPDSYFPIDIRQGASGVAIGGPSTEDALDIFMPTKIIRGTTSGNPLTVNDGTDDVLTVDWDGSTDLGPMPLSDADSGVHVHGSNISTASQAASASVYGLIVGGFDSGGDLRSYLKHVDLASGLQGAQLETRREVNGANVYNGLELRIDPSGNRTVTVSDAAAWLTALGIRGSIELYGGTPYIDFHFNNSTADYTSRIIESASGVIDIKSPNGVKFNNAALGRGSGGTGVTAKQASTVSLNNSAASTNHAWHNGILATVTLGALHLTSALANESSRNIGTVPSGYRPSDSVWIVGGTNANASTGKVFIAIASSGAITLYNRSGASLGTGVNMYFTATYAI